MAVATRTLKDTVVNASGAGGKVTVLVTFDDETSTGTYRLYQDSSITLGLLNQDLDVTRTYQLVGVYPVTVGEIGFDTAGTGAPVNFTATLAYQYWRRRSLGIAL